MRVLSANAEEGRGGEGSVCACACACACECVCTCVCVCMCVCVRSLAFSSVSHCAGGIEEVGVAAEAIVSHVVGQPLRGGREDLGEAHGGLVEVGLVAGCVDPAARFDPRDRRHHRRSDVDLVARLGKRDEVGGGGRKGMGLVGSCNA